MEREYLARPAHDSRSPYMLRCSREDDLQVIGAGISDEIFRKC
jgi:hypothetical protein